MQKPLSASFNDVVLTVQKPSSDHLSIVDHPSTWLDLLEMLPVASTHGALASAAAPTGAHAGHVTVLSASKPHIEESGLQGARLINIAVQHESGAFDAAFVLGIAASVDHVAVSLTLTAVDEGVLQEQSGLTWLAITSTALGEQIGESLALMHSRLASDMSETTYDVAVVMPDERYGAVMAACVQALQAVQDSAVRPCSIRYVSTLANARKAPKRVQASKESARIALSTEQRLALALNLVRLRETQGFSQLEVSFQALGFSKSHAAVSRLERGILNDVESERLAKLAKFFGTSTDALLGNKTVSAEPSDTSAPEEEPIKAIFDPDCALAPAAHYGKRITLARTSAGLSQSALARKLGHAFDATLQGWESETIAPRRVTFIDIATALNVPVSWLMFGRRTETPARGVGLRLTAMQKLYGLSNSELASLMDNTEDISSIEKTGKLLSRLSRGRSEPSPEALSRLAHVLQVPQDWIAPPKPESTERRLKIESVTNSLQQPAGGASGEPDNKLQGLNKAALKLVSDLIELIQMGVIEEKDYRTLREDLIAKFTTPYIRRGRKRI